MLNKNDFDRLTAFSLFCIHTSGDQKPQFLHNFLPHINQQFRNVQRSNVITCVHAVETFESRPVTEHRDRVDKWRLILWWMNLDNFFVFNKIVNISLVTNHEILM